jgi:hypothetical protein
MRTPTRDTVHLSESYSLFSCLSENGPPEEHPQLTQQALKSPKLLELRIKAAPDLGAQLIHPPHLTREYKVCIEIKAEFCVVGNSQCQWISRYLLQLDFRKNWGKNSAAIGKN